MFIWCLSSVKLFSSTQDTLAGLNGALTQLANQFFLVKALPGDLEYSNFFDQLVGKTKNKELQKRLKKDIQELKELALNQQQLAKYLLELLFENKPFAVRYLNGGLYPDFIYKKQNDYLFADGSTDLITRIMLVLEMVHDIEQSWSKKEDITIVSLGGGYLLQDYMLIHALYFRGYKHSKIIVIDPIDHTEDLEQLINQDRSLSNLSFSVKHFASTTNFLLLSKGSERAINACYIVSPTNEELSRLATFPSPFKDRKFNVIRVGKVPAASMIFYLPHQMTSVFARCPINVEPAFVKPVIETLNKSLQNNKHLPHQVALQKALQALSIAYPTSIFIGENIMLDFYDIIKSSLHKNCFGYTAFKHGLERYISLANEPYWKLNYEAIGTAGNEITWIYNEEIRKFEQL